MAMVAYVWNHIPGMKTKEGNLLSRVALLEGHTRLFSLEVLRAFGTKCHYVEDDETEETEEACVAHQCTELCEARYLSTMLNYVSATPKTTGKVDSPMIPTDPTTKPTSIPAPKNRREALQSPWWPGYFEAELAEMQSHAKNGTWMLVPPSEVPKGCAVLRDRWA